MKLNISSRLGMEVTRRSVSALRLAPIFDMDQTRHVLPNGYKKFLVNNVNEVDLLLMHNKSFAVEVAHNVSSRKRVLIVER
jgi:ribosomal protein L32E